MDKKCSKIGKSKIADKPKSVKKKIEFGNEKAKAKKMIAEQVNNNATIAVGNNKIDPEQGRSRPARNVEQKGFEKDVSCNKVQWTKEFLEKVRRSNERHKKKADSKQSAASTNNNLSLQEMKADGINTMVEGVVESNFEEEELDYNDDLSTEDDEFQMELSDEDQVIFVAKEDANVNTQRGQGHHHGHDNARPRTSSMNANSDLLNKDDEESLRNNPVIQCMMEQFFQEKFEAMQMEKNKKDVGKGKSAPLSKKGGNGKATASQLTSAKVLETNHVKSPSDTTIYVPTLQNKLTPPVNFGNGNLHEFPKDINFVSQQRHDANEQNRSSPIIGHLQHEPNRYNETNMIRNFVENV